MLYLSFIINYNWLVGAILKSLFISMAKRNKKGYVAEKIVWEAVKKTFAERECFAYWSFPIFNQKYNSRTEPDILIVDKDLGMTIIEVKGITIETIVSIQGHQWNYQNYYIDKGDPYQQAEHQMFSLMDWMPKMHNKFTKRVLVALPYITRAEWAEKGFDKLPSNPPIIFKDDLTKEELLGNISSVFLKRAQESLLDEDWAQCYELLNGTSVEVKENNEPVYSLLYIPSKPEDIERNHQYFLSLLQKGIKIMILSPYQRLQHWFKPVLFKPFEKAYLFQYIYADISFSIEQPIQIIDGEGIDEQFEAQWLKRFPSFNREQYKAEHAPIDDNLMIKAGAGTGKTTVMIQRIMFLLAMVPNIQLKDIVMITFTKESAREMKQRLKKELVARQHVTKQPIYLQFAEQLKEMNVSTIHAFAKSLLQELGFVLGFGRNVRLTSFTEKRREIISKVLDEYVTLNDAENVKIQYNNKTLRNYERQKIIEAFWNEMESKGLTEGQIEDIIWSTSSEQENNPFAQKTNELFKDVFLRCEKKFNALKTRENAITIGDLVRKISEISNEKPETLKELSYRFGYLFVDEFQDSDDVQIQLVAQLHKMIHAKLFVVGDIKQSIYRFRSADYTAFKRLTKQVKQPFTDEPLRINYRTSSSLLEKLDGTFNKWSQLDYLSYGDNDQLISYIPSTFPNNEFLVKPYVNKDQVKGMLVEEIRHAIACVKNQRPIPEKSKVAVLVRTNEQAKQVYDWLEKNNIAAEMNVGGTFFNTEAVKDFYSLLRALLYPNDVKTILNAFATPYFKDNILVEELVGFEGNNVRILDYLRQNYNLNELLEQHVKKLRYRPVFAVIRQFMRNDIYQNVYSKKISFAEELTDEIRMKCKFDVEKYRTNLNHLMNIIHNKFDSTNATLYMLYKWLEIKIKTDRTEDEPLVDDEQSQNVVEIVTVHKSKGLEYHTVVMPFTTYPFHQEWDEILFDDKKARAGWYIKKLELHNQLYVELNTMETEEIVKEETRLLYVAVTRTRERLIIMQPKYVKENTWSALLKGIKGDALID